MSPTLSKRVFSALAVRGGKWIDAFDQEDAEFTIWPSLWRALPQAAIIRYRMEDGALKCVLFDRDLMGREERIAVWEVNPATELETVAA